MAEDLQALAEAGRELEERSGIGSASSEERDAVETGRRIQDELERRSNSSGSSHQRRYQTGAVPPPPESDVQSNDGSCASLGTTNSVRAIYKAPATAPSDLASKLRSDPGASSSSGRGPKGPAPTPIRDKVELAVLEAKRAAMDKAKREDDEKEGKLGKPGSGSGSHAGGGGSGSHVGSVSGSAGSGSHPSHHGGLSSTTFGLSQSQASSLPQQLSKAATVAQAVLPTKVVDALPAEKLQEVENVMEVVVEKTGAELAEMQRALETSKQKAAAEAREKAELEARMAQMKVKNVGKDHLVEALNATREKTAEVQDQRDDLHDKLVGMETLLNAKMERYQKDIEELRDAGKKREEELKRKAEQDKAKLIDELAVAAKEIEKSKKQKIAALSERDVIRRAEMLAQKQVQAEMQGLKAEMQAAKLAPKSSSSSDDLGDLGDGESPEEQKGLQEKLKMQRDNNRRLASEFEKLRLDMLQAHQEKEEELSDLRAKVEVANAVPLGKIAQAKARKKAAGGKSKLSSIDEEEDEDMASQAGSGVSGQVSSDCDGVGDLRDFDDYDPKSDEVRKLREQLADSEAWYKHLNEIKMAKETEHNAKIERLAFQMQAFREEAKAKKDEVERLKAVTEEIDAEKQAELALVQSKLDSVWAREAVTDSDRQKELEDKVDVYAGQLLELRERLSTVVEEKRVVGLRLTDTQRELEATETRYTKIVADLKTQLNLANGGTGEDVEETENDLLSRVNALEEERNILRNELECQQVHWEAQLENEQRQCAATLNKLKEEQDLAEKDRELKAQVELSLKESQRMLVATRQALKEAEAKAASEAERAAIALAGQPSGTSVIAWLRCPTRSAPVPAAQALAGQQSPTQARGESPSCQAMIWQIVNTMGGVAALFCSDEAMTINDASKKSFAMWGSSSLRGASLYSLVYDQAMASWLKTEMATPTTPAFLNASNMANFWVRELGCVEFRSKLGSAFDASVTCVRLPEEVSHARAGAVLVIVEPVQEEQQQMRARQQPSLHSRNVVYRRGPASTTSSVHSEDITANDSVSNVNAKW